MNYAMDACHKRFSAEQMQEMQSNLSTRQIAKASEDLRKLPPPQKVLPAPNDSNISADAVQLYWNSVQGAFAYHVQIARFGDWNFLNYDQLVYDTTAIADLFGDWNYAWRVRAITGANTCSDFGSVDTFRTRQLASGERELYLSAQHSLYPNPVRTEEKILVKTSAQTQVFLLNQLGQQVGVFEPNSRLEVEMKIAEAGIYFVVFKNAQSTHVKRLLVQ
jgi:hypothetical protein